MRYLALALLCASCGAAPPLIGPCPICPESGASPSFCEDGLSPKTILRPSPGELSYRQLGLPGRSLGEAALIVGPDGNVVLIDAANDAHTKELVSALKDTHRQMNASGFVESEEQQLSQIILTHFHADHMDGVAPLLEEIELTGFVIHRGMFDLTEAANFDAAEELCTALKENQKELPLCAGERAPCDASLWSQSFPAESCPGLSAGDLLLEGDQGTSFLSLGQSSKISLLAVNGFIGARSFEEEVEPFLTKDTNGENARSLVGVIEHGFFRLLFAGDLTGGGEDTNPVEAFYAEHLSEVIDLDTRGVDILHAGHHGRDTSSSTDWVNTLLPKDGRARNVVIGVSGGHLHSPQKEAVSTLSSIGLEGFLWTTQITAFGAESEKLLDADGGDVLLQTFEQGRFYVIQRLDRKGRLLESRGFSSVRCGDL